MPHWLRKIFMLGGALFCVGPLSAAAPSLSGEWYFDVLTSPNGPGQREVLFLQEGSRVIGFVDSNSASGRFVGQVNDTALEFTAVLEFGGQPMAAVYRATVVGDTMRGEIEYGLYGKATFVGHRGRRPVVQSDAAPLIGSARAAGLSVAVSGDFFGVLKEDHLLPEMIPVNGGRFLMGSDSPDVNPDYGDDFAHVHSVEVTDFALSRFEITNAQFQAFAEATGYAVPLPPKGWDNYLSQYPNHPVTNVSYADARAYTDWLSQLTGTAYRLPTEAEWEYAARAGTAGQNYISGNDWDINAANISVWRIGAIPDRDGWKTWWDSEGERLSKTQPMTTRVGQFDPNVWGFYDLTGNVWEWTHDWYQADYYLNSPARNPPGPVSGDEKALRGCSWYNKPDVCFIATRDRYAPDVRLYYIGFRVVSADSSTSP